jgi:release factor glutamine methyltransferase
MLTAPTTSAEALQRAGSLAAVSDTPRLDAELLLMAASGVSRTALYAWPEQALSPAVAELFQAMLARRAAGEPIAHITGRREFWSLDLSVNNATLIPRPDTEILVEVALSYLPLSASRILDLGTGTGAIALALATERPNAFIYAVDNNPDAVALAQYNANNLALKNVFIDQASWLDTTWAAQLSAGQRFDMIVSNPPYIDQNDHHLAEGDLRFEPLTALVAAEGGLSDIAAIISLAPNLLIPGGYLWLEHGWQQQLAVNALLQSAGYNSLESHTDFGGNPRVTGGRWQWPIKP